MAGTYKTDPPRRIAERRAERDADGKPKLPQIKSRHPHHGDVHPVPAKVLRQWLRIIPAHYYYLLRRIELRARPGEIGRPYGFYSPHEREIVLYSLPKEWRVDIFAAGEMRKYGAEIQFGEDDCLIRWREHARLGLWFFHTVITHELGHHYVEAYHPRNGRVYGRDPQELVAELHSYRLSLDWWTTSSSADKAQAKHLASQNSLLRDFAKLNE